MAMTDWWAGLAPAEATIDCDGHHHRLRWAQGALVALDHDDPESERVLASIGGSPCPCIETLDAWEAHATDLRVLALAPRGAFEGLVPVQFRPGRVAGYSSSPPGALAKATLSGAWAVTTSQGTGRTVYRGARPMRPGVPGGAARPAPPEAESLVRLLYLEGGLPDRLVASVVAHWSARLDAAHNAEDADLAGRRSALTAALYGRAATAVRTWLRDNDLRVTVAMTDRHSTPSFRRADDGIALSLPFAWLPEVWSRGLATVLDRFCLSATMTAEGDRIRWDLVTVDPHGDTAPVAIEGPA